MIIWNGLGFIGALILVIAIIATSELGDDLDGWAFLISAVPVWLLGRYFYKRPAEMEVDPKTQQNVLVKPEHTLFFIELDYWGIMFAIYGLALLLPETGANEKIAMRIIAVIYFGRLGYNLYHKYLKKFIADKNTPSNGSTSPAMANTTKNTEEDKLSQFAAKSRDKKKFSRTISTKDSLNKDQGLPASELKKKAYYAQMRKDRAAPKKFAESNHQNYFPANSNMPLIPTRAILNKDTVFEEE